MILILYLSYLFTKFIGSKSIKTASSSNMKIVDRLAISQDKSIVVLKTENKYFLLAVSPTDIKLITELDEFNENNTGPDFNGNIYQNIDFKSIFSQYFPNKKK